MKLSRIAEKNEEEIQKIHGRGDDADGPADGLHAAERAHAGPPEDRPHRRRGAARHGQDGVRAEHRLVPDDPREVLRRLLLARDVGRAARLPHPVLRGAREPPAPARGAALSKEEKKALFFSTQQMREAQLYVDDSPAITLLEMRARALQLKQRARPRRALRGLPPDHGDARQGGEPHAGGQRLLARPQGARQGARGPRHRPLAAVAPHRAARRREGARALGPARVGRHRAGRRRRPLPLAARVLRQGHGAEERLRRHHRQAAERPDGPLHARVVRASTRASPTSR